MADLLVRWGIMGGGGGGHINREIILEWGGGG